MPAHDPANQVLVRETAALLAGVLRELRDDGLLTAAALTALPLDAARFEPGSMFRPLFETVRAALAAEALIPADGAVTARPASSSWPAAGTYVSCRTPVSSAPCTPRPARPGSPTSPLPSQARRSCGVTCGTSSASRRSRPRAW